MNPYFQNKVVWLTGASSGIGESLTYALAKTGARLIISSRKQHELERVAALTGLPESDITILPLDLAEYQSMPGLTQKVIENFGRIDILINNAGISQRSGVLETTIEVDRQLMDVNYIGTIALTKAVLPHMIAAGSGQIVSIGSVAGEVATPRRSSYAAAKHALIGFMDSLRAEVYDKNIQVCVINPGYVRTNISINALTGDGSPQGTMDGRTENGISPEDCAARILRAISSGKAQAYVAGALEMLAVIVKRISPALLRVMIRKVRSS